MLAAKVQRWKECLDRMVPASLLQEKGLGLRVVTGSGQEDSGGVTVLCSERPGDALERTLKITSCLNGEGGVEKTFQGLEALGQLLGQWWR